MEAKFVTKSISREKNVIKPNKHNLRQNEISTKKGDNLLIRKIMFFYHLEK